MPNPASLAQRRQLPPGGTTSELRLSDGWRLRAHVWAEGAADRLPILFCGGRADFIEKYAETLWHWRAQGHALLAFDMRGYGLSGRPSQHPERDYNADFERLVVDYAEVFAQASQLLGRAPVPVAHSMGGHILLRWLADYRPAVRGAVLLSPMLGIGHGFRTWVLGWLSHAMARVQGADNWAFGQGAYGPDQQSAARAAILTASAERFADEGWWVQQQSALAMGGVSWGWLMAATESITYLNSPGLLEQINTPIALLMGAQEKLVDPKAAARMAQRLPQAHYYVLAQGRHELLRDQDTVQAQSWRIIDEFLAGLA